MRQTRFVPLGEQYNSLPSSANFAFPYLRVPLYTDMPVRASTVPLIKAYWHAYWFKGFGDYVSTTQDLLRFERALAHGVILSNATQRLAYQAIYPKIDQNNGDPFSLGWEIRRDASLGTTVYHGGETTGSSCILMRNLSRHQTVILFDNSHDDARLVAIDALRILSGADVPAPQKSIAQQYALALLKGDAVATQTMHDRLIAAGSNSSFDEVEVNAMGYDLMADKNVYEVPQQAHLDAAIAMLKLNTELFPQSWNAWDSFGEALRKEGRIAEAIAAYERSLALNPESESAKTALAEMR
jgi:tetratricopeptide (TPR) repeat protein